MHKMVIRPFCVIMSYMFPMFTWVGVFGFILMFFRPRWRYFSTSNSWWIGKADILYPLGIQQDNRNLIHLYTNFIFQVVTFIAISDYLWVTTGITLYSWPSPSTLKRIEFIFGHSKYVLCIYIYIYLYIRRIIQNSCISSQENDTC